MINIAVLGYGTIGSGVVEVIETNHESINRKIGEPIRVKYVLDKRDLSGTPVASKAVTDYDIILNDDDVSIVVEVLGGVEPAYTFAKQALEHGKSVATSNKELVAEKGAELLAMAKSKNLNFLFEASVGGGIPIIRPLNQSLTADEINEITGILNGTTNYILTKMADEGADFDEVLKDAQNKGYAELHPEADVEGYDACRKIAILTSLAFGMQVDYEDVHTEGITKITETDMKYAKALNKSIKLLGTSKKIGDNVYAMVCPMMIGRDHPLIGVNDVFNGIFVNGNVIGDVMFYGAGAGKLPTASAVVADVIDAAKHKERNIMQIWSEKKLHLTDIGDFEHKFFVRLPKDCDREKVKEVFGDVEEVSAEGVTDEVAFVTLTMKEKDYQEKIKAFDSVLGMIRINVK